MIEKLRKKKKRIGGLFVLLLFSVLLFSLVFDQFSTGNKGSRSENDLTGHLVGSDSLVVKTGTEVSEFGIDAGSDVQSEKNSADISMLSSDSGTGAGVNPLSSDGGTGAGINPLPSDSDNGADADLSSQNGDSASNRQTVISSGNDTVLENNDRSNVPTDASSVRVVMVGDVLLHTPVSDSGLMEDGTYDYHHLFAHVQKDISSADLALVNQEAILGGTELGLSGYPAFNGAYEVGDALADAGFDVVLHATNHALDKGKTGILNCLNYWRTFHPEIGVIGINDSAGQQETVYVTEVKGIRIAILNYTYGTNGIPLPADMPYAVNLIDRDKIARDIRSAREQADFVIVCPHWGIEYTHEENSSQTELAVFMAEQGADLIIGAHPHVVQPVRWVEAANGNRALVYYSLGNFINATSEYGDGVADRMLGAMADVTITRSGQDGMVVIEDYQAVPLVTQMLTGCGRITTYKLSDYSPQLAAENEVMERDAAFSYDYCVDLARRLLGYEG